MVAPVVLSHQSIQTAREAKDRGEDWCPDVEPFGVRSIKPGLQASKEISEMGIYMIYGGQNNATKIHKALMTGNGKHTTYKNGILTGGFGL